MILRHIERLRGTVTLVQVYIKADRRLGRIHFKQRGESIDSLGGCSALRFAPSSRWSRRIGVMQAKMSGSYGGMP